MFASYKLSTIVDQGRAVTHQAGKLRQRRSHMARAANHQARLRLYALEKNLRLAPLGKRRREFLYLKDARFRF